MAAMNFNTTNSTFRQLLGNGLSYRVPTFQRDYSWSEDEWDDLWQDIVGLSEADPAATEPEPAHYMGYLVLQSANNKQFDIIDGQQRLTTLSVMILAALAYLQDLVSAKLDSENNHKRKEQLQNSYIGYVDPVSLVSKSKLSLNRHNDQFYQTYLVPLDKLPQRGLNASEHLLRRAFIWFKDRIKAQYGMETTSGKTLAAFLDQLVDKLFFTVITVTDELNAFKVFETLNARGVRLSATDLLKNYLFSVISHQSTHETEFKSLEERWERIVGLLGSESFPEFLRVFWNSQNRLVRKSDLFKTIRKHVTTREQAFHLLRELDQSAAVYSALRDPFDTTWNDQEKRSIQQLLMFSVRQPMAMLLACHKQFFDEKRELFTKTLKAIAVLSFRYNVICNLQSHDQERLYNDIAIKVSKNEHNKMADIISSLKKVYPEDAPFKAAFAEKELRTTNSRNKKIVRYALFEIERQQSGKEFDVESANYNLEHILPENPSEEWSDIDEAIQDRMIYRLGNLTPCETKINRELGNMGYAKKRAAYQKSDFQLTKAVAEHYDVWDESKVMARQKKLANIAAGIWKI